MTYFNYLHPLTKALYFGLVFLCIMLIFNPLAMLIAWAGLLLTIKHAVPASIKGYGGFFGYTALAIILINFLFNHRGTHIVTYFMDKPLTLEALIYGLTSALMIICIVILFQTVSSSINTSEFLYLFGGILPQLGFIVSMTCGFVYKCSARGKEIQQVVKMKNIDMNTGTLKERSLAGMQIMHALIALTLENALVTVQTMKTRAYNMQRRTSSFSYKIRTRDRVFTLIACVLAGSLIYIWGSGIYNLSVYPSLELCYQGLSAVMFYGLYMALLLLPLYKCGSYQQKLRLQSEGTL